MIKSARIIGKVEYREGDGPDITIRPGLCEVQESPQDATISWTDGDSRGSATIPIDVYRRYVSNTVLVVEGCEVAGVATAPEVPEPDGAASSESRQIGQNIAAVHEFYSREELKRSVPQRHAESIDAFVGRPAFLVAILLFVALWIGVNLTLPAWGMAAFDEPPFSWLQGISGLAALLTTTVVLIKQNRMAKLGDQRAHLDLKVSLLIEQKAAKLIDLMEELRRDLPNVRDRRDPGAGVMQQAMCPEEVLAALDEEVTLRDGSTSPSTAAVAATVPLSTR